MSKKPKKTKRPRPPKPMGAWRLFKAALKDYRVSWRRYVLIILIVALPVDLLLLNNSFATSAAFQTWVQVALVAMNVALIWGIVAHERTGRVSSLAEAYYDGSAAFIRALILMVALVLMLLPAAIATVLYIIGTLAVEAVGTLPEQILITFTCILIAMISVWLLVRFALAPLIAIADGLTPLHALRYSRALTLGRFWRVFSRYAAIIFFILLVAVPIGGVTALLSALKLAPVATLFFQLATTFTALPLFNLYLLRFYRNLEKGFSSVNTPDESVAEAKPA